MTLQEKVSWQIKLSFVMLFFFCNAAFRSVTLYRFLLKSPTGPEFGNVLHYKKKAWGINYVLQCITLQD